MDVTRSTQQANHHRGPQRKGGWGGRSEVFTCGVGAWSLELGAKKFHEQRTTGPLLFESAPAPPSAGFIVTFEDLTLYTAAGAPLIFARLTAV